MTQSLSHTLIITVGTSLFQPNLRNLPTAESYPQWLERQPTNDRALLPLETVSTLKRLFDGQQFQKLSQQIAALPASLRLMGAESNSIQDLIQRQYVTTDARLIFCVSDTPDGKAIGDVFRSCWTSRGHEVEIVTIDGLQDKDTRLFRTLGLRNLAKTVCGKIRSFHPNHCAINATGGYKAQIAIAVLIGQAIGVPVYYKHEQFNEIIAFPPMPVAFDFEIWMAASGMLFALSHSLEGIPASEFEGELDEKLETLVERVEIDGTEYLALSPTGEIFHEAFRQKFQSIRDRELGAAAPSTRKEPPRLEKSGHMLSHPGIGTHLKDVTREIPQVIRCDTHYFNPDLPSRNRFRYSQKQVEGVFSDGTYTVKFWVLNTATTEGQTRALVAALNEWLEARK